MIEYIDIIRTILISFLITLILGPLVIPLLRRLKIGQNVRDDGPESHLSKGGTPTMGGIIIFLALIITVLTSDSKFINKDMYVLLLSTLGFGAIGFIDDYYKVINRRSLGLTARQKLLGQLLLGLILAYYQYNVSGSKMIVPFMKDYYLDIGILFIPFITFVVVGTVNSVNLTDGLDGLATGVTLIVLSFFGIVSLNRGMGSIAIFSTALAGACLGFLIHNAHPAKVFMGDTGSLGLGGAIAGIALLLNMPLLIPIVGGVYLIEALSVIIQVSSYKLTGKRVFKMAPLHHHFEEKGWKETSVVAMFWITTVILCLIGILSLS